MDLNTQFRSRRPLPGVPANIWLLCCVPFVLVLAAGSLYFGIVSGGRDLSLQGLLFLVGIVGLAFFGLYSYRTAKELEAHYTTDPWRHRQVDFCDWKTGAVLREAGQPIFPNWSAFHEARRSARQRARESHE